jgi:hypothetical protein
VPARIVSGCQVADRLVGDPSRPVIYIVRYCEGIFEKLDGGGGHRLDLSGSG